MKLFCFLIDGLATTETVTNDDLMADMAGVFEPNAAQVYENTVKLLAWISRRYYEVMIFQSLQNDANRINSLSTNELSEVARELLRVLSLALY
jgi:hypothetical protein